MRWCRSDEFEMPNWEALPIVVDIEGDELAARLQTFLEKFLLIEATREQHIISVDSVARLFERERCCDGRGVPRRPASGRTGPHAHAELSRGTAGQRRGIVEAFEAATGGTA